MKKTICCLAIMFICLQIFSQDEPLILRIEVGPCLHFNNLNEDSYFDFMNRNYRTENTSMAGVNMKFSLNYKAGLDIIFGALAEIGLDDFSTVGYSPGSTNSSDYVLNGGGVYVGLNPNTNGKNFGIDADIAAGIFAYKEYRVIFNNIEEPFVSILDKKSSVFGGMASLGFYLRSNHIGISPEAQVIMAGGGNGSFLFWGFCVPLTISF